ncbi:phospholipase A2 [Streptomyces sp. NPDC020362]|uniref:phospholipase A2 n=1 Tax=unclassified Streptomyces TaxID=2593676 RepID=UPI0033C47312
MGFATAALGVTGIGLTATSAHAEEASTPFSADAFKAVMNSPLDDFAKYSSERDNYVKEHPEEFKQRQGKYGPEIVDKETGIRVDTDGCSVPGWLQGATGIGPDSPAQVACQRHDLGYRTLQENHLWSQAGKDQIDARFRSDLEELRREGKLEQYQVTDLDVGGTLGSQLPKSVLGYEVTGISDWDDPTGEVPYTYTDSGAGVRAPQS